MSPRPTQQQNLRRASIVALVGVFCIVAAACGPNNRRTQASTQSTPTPTPSATATATASPTATPGFRQAFVRVVGTAGTPFVGQLIDGSGSRSVDGVVPQDFVLGTARDFISATFSKTDAGLGTITGQIFVEGSLVAEQSTTTNFGTITINYTVR